jgi:flagellar basal-body rod modification protein FlgD
MSNFNVNLMNQLGLTTAASNSNSSTVATASDQLNQSDFLKLMTTQLNNQDPTQPSDSSQMLAQMAQLSTVSGIQSMQSSLQQLVKTMMASQTTQAAGLVGHQVIAAGSGATLTSNGLAGAIDLTQDTNQLTVGIYDSAGQLVKQVNMGTQSQGTVPFSWNGIADNGAAAPDGLYQIRASANINGTAQAMSTYVASTVDSVTVDSATQNIMLNTSGGDAINISDIKQLM